jgi:hypothetical protein
MLSASKPCVLPVCRNQKFDLVHKFPSDFERFTTWMTAIDYEKIPCLVNNNQDSIKKKFFLCSRHFGLSSYKNEESRSLNITAVPHLNLKNLDQLHKSKAYQLEQMKNKIVVDSSSPDLLCSKRPNQPIILNKLASNSVQSQPSHVTYFKAQFNDLASKRKNFAGNPSNTSSKKPKIFDEIDCTDLTFSGDVKPKIVEVLHSPEKQSKQNPRIPQMSSTSNTPSTTSVASQHDENEGVKSEQSKNKFLALIEVNSDQYKHLERILKDPNKMYFESVLNLIDKNAGEADDDNGDDYILINH